MGRRFASGVMALCGAAVLSPPAGALPTPPRPGSAVEVVPTLLVCDAESCRHRFKGWRARPNWNGYWARQAAGAAGRRPAAARSRR